MMPSQNLHTGAVLADVFAERHRQHAKWGEQNYPISLERLPRDNVDFSRAACEAARILGHLDWRVILQEEIDEAYAEAPDSPEQRAELVQCAALIVAMIENIDQRSAEAADRAGAL